MSREHDLKTWPEYFQAVYEGRKPFDYRLNDRGFEVGDILNLREYVPPPTDVGANPNDGGYYTGRSVRKRVTYILDDRLGPTMRDGFVVMGIADPLSEPLTPGRYPAPIDEEFVAKARKTMKAFQVGFGGRDALAKAHDAMADGYGIIGRLLIHAGHQP